MKLYINIGLVILLYLNVNSAHLVIVIYVETFYQEYEIMLDEAFPHYVEQGMK